MPEEGSSDHDVLLAEQVAYYRARSGEYDEWWRREGRYDHGTEAKQQWDDEVAEVENALDAFAPKGEVLELACGTGWWTARLARYTPTLTSVDASREVIALNRARLAEAGRAPVRYVEADIFGWQPDQTYDVVFFSFWLSHVPSELFERFWSVVEKALKPCGRVFLIDSARTVPAGASGHHAPTKAERQERQLNDGRTFHIVKHFYEPEPLAARLRPLGWRTELHRSEFYFLYGSATRA